MLVSSANKTEVALPAVALGKLAIYKRNNNGPKIEPCGTPYFILVHFEIVIAVSVFNFDSLIPII
jgi:hypothetical protein